VISSVASSKSSKKSENNQMVDAGSFGVFVNGKRIATEKFEIQQREGYSVTSSELKMEDGSKAAQASELQVLANGNLRKYEWREVSPGKAKATVAPSEQFLIERVSTDPNAKQAELAFILPPSTQVVDDYFFSHREVLLWRYIATACATPGENNQCKMDKSQFGIFVPRQQTPVTVSLEYKGSEKVQIRGADRQLERFDMTADGLNWSLWLDSADNYKLQRILIAAENTEVVRD
jgi:hypothetical protein